jgi:deferrochelatase/peroxidase EfeB
MTDTSGEKAMSTLSTNRRNLLLGIGAAAGGTLASALTPAQAATDGAHAADAPSPFAGAGGRQPFHGLHQAGITTPRPANGMVAAFNAVVREPADLEALFRRLTERIVFLTQGGQPPDLDPKFPPADSGILGPVVAPDDLTITVSLGASLFADRPWLKPHMPRQLQRMVQFPNDALDPDICHGDIALQICANTQDTAIHALRDIVKNLSEFLVLRWLQDGNVPAVTAHNPDGTRQSARNFLGFRDGTANPDSTDTAAMDRIVWVGPTSGEPEWAVGGSYQAVRIIRNFVERWDRTPLSEQQTIIGRKKASGAPLDGTREHDVPHYPSDPHGKVTPLTAHIRLANRRDRASQDHLILRRPFNYSNGVTRNGQIDQGLLFIAYQADLAEGFIAVQNRLTGEPLEEYVKPVGGGYFFVLPGVRSPSGYLGQQLVAAVASPDTNRP